jgi:hypothetical protein
MVFLHSIWSSESNLGTNFAQTRRMPKSSRFSPYTHAHEGRLWLAAQSYGCTSTLAHHSGNFLNARICNLFNTWVKLSITSVIHVKYCNIKGNKFVQYGSHPSSPYIRTTYGRNGRWSSWTSFAVYPFLNKKHPIAVVLNLLCFRYPLEMCM